MTPSLLVLDQWAKEDVGAGTSKNWLYDGFRNSFDTRVVNADDASVMQRAKYASLALAILTRPLGFRAEYSRIFCSYGISPRGFRTRTERFQRAVDRLGERFDAVFQPGALFGPVSVPGTALFSYHDQTVAITERVWPEWLPRNFAGRRDEFFELERAALQVKDQIFTYSEFARSSMLQDYHLAPDKVMVAPTACKIGYPSRKEVLEKRRPTLLFASTDFWRKGGDVVFEAFVRLRRTRPDLALVLVGGRPGMPLPDGANYLGVIDFQRLRDEYLSASLIVHPARFDAYPNVLKEAQACGLPAVASSSGGIPEIVENGSTGTILETVDATALADSVDSLLSDQERLHSMRLQCLTERERFRPDACVARIVERMEEVLVAKKGGGHG